MAVCCCGTPVLPVDGVAGTVVVWVFGRLTATAGGGIDGATVPDCACCWTAGFVAAGGVACVAGVVGTPGVAAVAAAAGGVAAAGC